MEDDLIRSLLGFTEIRLRVAWLRDRLEHQPLGASARELDALCAASERCEAPAREGALVLAVLLSGLADDPLVGALREEAAAQQLVALGRLVRRADPLGLLAPPPDERPVPDYGAGRELTLGERKSLARRPGRGALARLLRDPHPQVMRQLLGNPQLTEDDVVRVVARRPANREVVAEVARRPEWLARRRVRFALLSNPGTVPGVALPLLAACTRDELRELVYSTDVAGAIRATAKELFDHRPPLVEPEFELLH